MNEQEVARLDDDDDWEKRRQEYEAHIEALSGSLRTCPTHGNAATIDKGYEGDLSILAVECGCWLQAEYYDSIDECVGEWNKQPQVDALRARIAALETPVAANALPLPDGPGWWGHDDNGKKRFVVRFAQWKVVGAKVTLVWGEDAYPITYEVRSFKQDCPGKWYRISVPWQE